MEKKIIECWRRVINVLFDTFGVDDVYALFIEEYNKRINTKK